MKIRYRTRVVRKVVLANGGFTLIEMMVSLALFTIVMTIATGAFLSLIGGSNQLQGEQTVMTSLNFAMDSMTREIRTGTKYYCQNGADVTVPGLLETQDCPGIGDDTLSFVESGSSLSGGLTGGRIVYFLDSTDGNKLMRKIGDAPAQSMLSSDVLLTSLRFYVSGAHSNSDNGDTIQPTVTVIVTAQDPSDTLGKVYTLETTVTQRELDI